MAASIRRRGSVVAIRFHWNVPREGVNCSDLDESPCRTPNSRHLDKPVIRRSSPGVHSIATRSTMDPARHVGVIYPRGERATKEPACRKICRETVCFGNRITASWLWIIQCFILLLPRVTKSGKDSRAGRSVSTPLAMDARESCDSFTKGFGILEFEFGRDIYWDFACSEGTTGILVSTCFGVIKEGVSLVSKFL